MPTVTYQIHLDLARDNTFAHDITPYVRYLEWSNGLDESDAEIAPPARLLMTVDNGTGAFWPEDGSASYFGLITSTIVRVRATSGFLTNQPLYIGKIVSIQPSLGVYGAKQVSIICDDLMPELLAAEYDPPLELNVTVDHALRTMFDEAVISYPYARSYWILGVSGASELGSTSKLFDATSFINFDTARTTLAFVGDNITPGAAVTQRSPPIAPFPLSITDVGAPPDPLGQITQRPRPNRNNHIAPFPHFIPAPAESARTDSVTTAYDFIHAMLAAEAGGRFFYDTRTAKFVFHDRSRDIENDTIFTTLTGDDLEAADYRYADDVVSHVSVVYQPRTIGQPASVLWSASNLPLRFAPHQERRITAHYQDPQQPGSHVGAMDFVALQAGTDYAAFIRANGTGNNVTSRLLVSVIFKASVAKLTITNTSAVDLYLTHLQVRGTPLPAYDHLVVSAVSGESLRDTDFRRRVIDAGAMSSDDDAATYAGYFLTRFKDATGRFAQVSFIASKSPQRITRALAATIGVRLTITESASGHHADYILVGEHHRVTPGSEHTHIVTWILKPASRDAFWMLGTAGKSELGTTTRLAF